MTNDVRDAYEWLLDRFPDQNSVLRAYSVNMVMFIAEQCAEYHKVSKLAAEEAAEDERVEQSRGA